MFKALALGLVALYCLILLFNFPSTEASAQPDSASLGRAVYIREGCIHCHSQYVRKEDEITVGPLRAESEMRSGNPPLIGNRRNGPDLLNVGNRRTEEWLRLYLHSPALLRPEAIMPSYAYLFETKDGEHLVKYLASLGQSTIPARQEQIKQWIPESTASRISIEQARGLFSNRCVVCHGTSGQGDGPLSGAFATKPRNLVYDKLRYAREGTSFEREDLARIIKFGTRALAETSMPGAENLSDSEVIGIADYVRSLRESQL